MCLFMMSLLLKGHAEYFSNAIDKGGRGGNWKGVGMPGNYLTEM